MLALSEQEWTSFSAPEFRSNATFRKTGAGACGEIFAQDGKSFVMHLEIYGAFYSYLGSDNDIEPGEVRVPKCHFFVPSDEESFWNKNPEILDAAKDVCNLPTAALVTERIWPLHSTTRELLIDKYCAPEIKDNVRVDVENTDCLARLDTTAMARSMGTALATLHWGASTDARDVEFVLGSCWEKEPWGYAMQNYSARYSACDPCTYTGPSTGEIEDFLLCNPRVSTELFVLDFSQVREITIDDEGVAMAVEAWRLNGPYYPKTLGETWEERDVCESFEKSYLASSKEQLDYWGSKEIEDLTPPQKFISGITEVERGKKSSRKAVRVDTPANLSNLSHV
ncbi:hypothetical protein QBC35DRAFT_517920 [Podospora australis]|uniref:DUF3669 domain-containing protein n=1 Tax=Podospora australis TaxID=1536484 RepID=A0AAN6WP84_9PEZI|nr:hypothetical protein QBC35DRAFT_517920 [Podospora australis]